MGRASLLVVSLLAACSFSPGSAGPRDGDINVLDDVMPDAVPDAGPCQSAGVASCTGDTLRTCTTVGQAPAERACAWGCTGASPTATCAELAPAGGWDSTLTGDTTTFTGLGDITLPDGAIIDTGDGSINLADDTTEYRASGTGVKAGIDYRSRNIGGTASSASVFRFRKLTISNLTLHCPNAIVLIADEGIDITGVIDGVPACLFADTRTAGPGGFDGGLENVDGNPVGAGGGVHGPGNDDGGGGGGHGGTGGDGGNNTSSGGVKRGDNVVTVLAGGAGGGGGDSHANSGHGGGGGAAIQLISNGPITISSTGGINAGGCGGRAGLGSNDGGGGGGAGGLILIEAPTTVVAGTLAVNGGGGGGGNTSANTVGEAGKLSRSAAAGGPAGGGSSGGDGAAGGTSVNGVVGTTGSGGGGGGGIGRIRLNTRAGAATITNATLSPGPNDAATTFTQGSATLR